MSSAENVLPSLAACSFARPIARCELSIKEPTKKPNMPPKKLLPRNKKPAMAKIHLNNILNFK
jgi:hypothetical protein